MAIVAIIALGVGISLAAMAYSKKRKSENPDDRFRK